MPLALKLPKPAIAPEDIGRVVDVLKQAPGWMTASEIAVKLHGLSSPTLERKIRAIASAAAPQIVSYPGSPGYRLWTAALPLDEVNHCIEALQAQGEDMIRRANVYRAAYHRRYRGPGERTEQAVLL